MGLFNRFKINGRFVEKENKLFFYNVGSGIAFKMNGSSFSLEADFQGNDGYLAIIVDRKYNQKRKIIVKNKEIIEYKFENKGVHYVDVIKVNEANDNTLSLSKFKFYGELLDYDFSYQKKIRIIGDSTIAGFGILAHDGDASIHTSDGVEDFCFRSLYNASYDFEEFASSGWGLRFSEYTKPKTIGIIDFIKYISTSSKEEWNKNDDFDMLVISLGTNDMSFIDANKNKEELIKEFKKTYLELIESQIQDRKIPTVMIYGTLDEKNCYSLVEETYKYISNKINNVHLLKFNGSSDAISNHAFVDTHVEMAKYFLKNIKKLI